MIKWLDVVVLVTVAVEKSVVVISVQTENAGPWTGIKLVVTPAGCDLPIWVAELVARVLSRA